MIFKETICINSGEKTKKWLSKSRVTSTRKLMYSKNANKNWCQYKWRKHTHYSLTSEPLIIDSHSPVEISSRSVSGDAICYSLSYFLAKMFLDIDKLRHSLKNLNFFFVLTYYYFVSHQVLTVVFSWTVIRALNLLWFKHQSCGRNRVDVPCHMVVLWPASTSLSVSHLNWETMTITPPLPVSQGYESENKCIKEFLKHDGSTAGGISNNGSSSVYSTGNSAPNNNHRCRLYLNLLQV